MEDIHVIPHINVSVLPPGNAITTIPVGAFNGIPNLEWINLGKNKLMTSGIAPHAFKVRVSPFEIIARLSAGIAPHAFKVRVSPFEIRARLSAGIAPHAFKGLKFLSRLFLDNNLLETVPTDLPSTLQELKINENHLKGIEENSFQGLSNLLILELEGNVLNEGNVDHQAFSPLSQLSYLRLGRNHFRTVPQGLPPSLLVRFVCFIQRCIYTLDC
uniref:Uncharacterized protein n=1 Tax=Hucho hucho TaxID=62062 RepID=A0A4W5KSM6_9TELE